MALHTKKYFINALYKQENMYIMLIIPYIFYNDKLSIKQRRRRTKEKKGERESDRDKDMERDRERDRDI